MFLFYVLLVSENVHKHCALMIFLPTFRAELWRHDGRCDGISDLIRFSVFFQYNVFCSNIFILIILVNFSFLFC